MNIPEDFRRELFGEWKVKEPTVSVGPWSVTESTGGYRNTERVWVVRDGNGRTIAEFYRRVDAYWTATHYPESGE